MPDTAVLSDDPLWFKDAIIYEVHIRAFQDSNGDGIGDINGLISRLDYLSDLGVTALWVLPFYPSPLKDGGYDISNYTDVHESYGTCEDFARLLQEAHRRGIRVITELVLNHTSAEHPWFQAARRAPPGSPEREFYVWSDTPARYEDTRIIFQDYETSNWAWDPVAKAYYWHRFYSHQPDLNFDNPAVHEAVFQVIDFWMELGVDGVRLDAVPYLYEREGTSCENLPETHGFLKKLRAHIDAKYKNRMLLAEANQWPADAAAYFGDGDECHMNFHFPVMPRLFMALETEDSFPIINILKRTPKIPASCQWATFLRNHDELTLEMVTDEDRDTMYRGYAAERAARINLGIRRRLAPLLGVRRKIELMTALLMSLPGTPVLYYGDEIGMGDNIYLGDRDGVRTPMQWSADRNGGFSRANPQKLYLPAIIDPDYHYEAINVEAQQRMPASLLWWTKRLLATRKEHKVFGRGSIDFVAGDNPRVLAFVREYEGEVVLVIANLSRFAQGVRLNLERFKTMIPRELFGRMSFPEVTDGAYFISLGPHGFYWLGLERPQVSETAVERPTLIVKSKWNALLEPRQRNQLARALVGYVTQRRWFRSKARVRKQVSIRDVLTFDPDARHAIALLSIEYDHGAPDTYVVPIAFLEDTELADPAIGPGIVIARVELTDVPERGTVRGLLYDALCSEPFNTALLGMMTSGAVAQGRAGRMSGSAFAALREHAGDASLVPRPTANEQSNSGILYGDRCLLKLFRAVEEGPNAELEMGRFLATQAPGYRGAPRLLGFLEYRQPDREPMTLGTLFVYVPNQGDAWQLAQDELERYFDRVLSDEKRPMTPPVDEGSLVEQAQLNLPDPVIDWIGPFLDKVRLLGRRTAELHVQLAAAKDDPLFSPEPLDLMHQQSIYGSAVAQTARTLDQLRGRIETLPAEQRELAEIVVAREPDLDQMLVQVTRRRIDAIRIRTHGDYHLGQVLWTGDDFAIIDFEGEPGRPLSQRRFKRNPLRDVAGMLRSLCYASAAALRSGRHRTEDRPLLDAWARAWSSWVSSRFLAGYLDIAHGTRLVPRTTDELNQLLEFYLLEKCVYEIGYELNNRPDWLDIPMRALLELLPPRS